MYKKICVFLLSMVLFGCTTISRDKEINTKKTSDKIIEYAEDYMQCFKNFEGVTSTLYFINYCDIQITFTSPVLNLSGLIAFGGDNRIINDEQSHESIGRVIRKRPIRLYKKIKAKTIYDKLIFILHNKNNINFTIIDKSAGIIYGSFKKYINKEFMFFKWRKKHYVTIVASVFSLKSRAS